MERREFEIISTKSCLHLKKINIFHDLQGQALGLKEVEENTWLVSFMV